MKTVADTFGKRETGAFGRTTRRCGGARKCTITTLPVSNTIASFWTITLLAAGSSYGWEQRGGNACFLVFASVAFGAIRVILATRIASAKFSFSKKTIDTTVKLGRAVLIFLTECTAKLFFSKADSTVAVAIGGAALSGCFMCFLFIRKVAAIKS